MRLNPDVSHKAALITLETSAFFPNVSKDSSSFYCNNGSTNKVITLPDGAYDIGYYNTTIK